jgi:hypothetical protein
MTKSDIKIHDVYICYSPWSYKLQAYRHDLDGYLASHILCEILNFNNFVLVPIEKSRWLLGILMNK